MKNDVFAHQLVRAVGDLCAFAPNDPNYDVRRIITLVVLGLKSSGE